MSDMVDSYSYFINKTIIKQRTFSLPQYLLIMAKYNEKCNTLK